MYDPSVGRWITEDPIGFDAGDMDLYRYVGNDPTDSIDPTGLDTAGGRMVLEEGRRELMQTLEKEQLRQQFPQGVAGALNNIEGVKRGPGNYQENLKTLESELKLAQERRRTHRGNKAITDPIDKQITLLEREITLGKAALARATRRVAILDEVNNLNKGAKDYDRVYSQKELEYLRLLKADFDSMPESLALHVESLQAGELVREAIRKARKK